MRIKIRKRLLAVLLFLSFLAQSGCSALQKENTEYENSVFVRQEPADEESNLIFMESEQIIAYQLPELVSNLLVDRRGYEGSKKIETFVQGKRLPYTVCVREKESGRVMCRGICQETDYDEDTGIYHGKFVFDSPGEGTYYLQCDYLGESFSFQIKDVLYGELLDELCGEVAKESPKDSSRVWDYLGLITAYEFHPDIFPDGDKNKIPDVLEKTAAWIRECDFKQMEGASEAVYSAFFAKFSYLYRQYDYTYASECLQMASAAFVRERDGKKKDGDHFLALVELFRATGLDTYGGQIEEYAGFLAEKEDFFADPGYLYGAMTYFMTRQNVDVDLCNFLVKKLMGRAEEAAARKCGVPNIWREPKKAAAEKMIEDVRVLICANYILASIQYNEILENVLHYLMGQNTESVNFFEEAAKADQLLIAAQLAGVYRRESSRP